MLADVCATERAEQLPNAAGCLLRSATDVSEVSGDYVEL
jgi:hypothetical protein